MGIQRSKQRRLRSGVLQLSWLAGLLAFGCRGDLHPEVLVLVNGESPISVAIGETYAARRGVPERNILPLSIPLEDANLSHPADASISRSNYETLIRDPVARFLERTGRTQEIEIIVTTLGIPLRVSGPRAPDPLWLRDTTSASVDAELALLFSQRDGAPGVVDMTNPYYDSEESFSRFRQRHPDSFLRYLVARLTGYPTEIDPETGVPRSILQLIDAAQAPAAEAGVWLVDEDPSRPETAEIANAMLLAPAAASLAALGLSVRHETTTEFASDVAGIQGYVSWGSSDGADPGAPTYGQIEGALYPGHFNPRALAMSLDSRNARSFAELNPPNASLVVDLVDAGAAGVLGHVEDPTLPGVARPHILLRRYAEGVPAAEAFFRSIPYLGWMNVYVGDPLMTLPASGLGEPPEDLDGDGVPDAKDNCSAVPNPEQRDSNDDGFGNLCDGDVDNDGRVTTSFGAIFPIEERGDIERIALSIRRGAYRPDHDLDGDDDVDRRDLSIAQLYLFLPPGPSGRTEPPDRETP
ncbi:MAG: TIGR03790 family protein [Myxococcota bacterium]